MGFMPGPRYGTPLRPEEYNQAVAELDERRRKALEEAERERAERIEKQSAGMEPVPPAGQEPEYAPGNAGNVPVTPPAAEVQQLRLSPQLVQQARVAALALGAGSLIGLVIALLIRGQQKFEAGGDTE